VSEVDFLGDFDFRVTQQQLDRAQIAGTAVDQYGLRAPQRMRAEFRRIKSNLAAGRLSYLPAQVRHIIDLGPWVDNA
jgi:hypothetical protein